MAPLLGHGMPEEPAVVPVVDMPEEPAVVPVVDMAEEPAVVPVVDMPEEPAVVPVVDMAPSRVPAVWQEGDRNPLIRSLVGIVTAAYRT